MKLFKKNDIKIEEKDELLGVISPLSIEAIYPFSFKENKDSVEMGGNYIRVIAFAEYPTEAKGNWLSDLKRLKGNITISQHLESADSTEMLNFYNSSIKNKNAELLNTCDPQQKMQLKKDIKSAEHQLEEALNNKSSFIYIYTYILFQAQSLEELKKLEDNIQRVLMKLHIKGIIPYYEMNKAYWSALPIGKNILKEYTRQMTDTTAASSFFPFDDSEICDLSPGSIIEGINKITNSIVSINYLDDFKTLNQNKVVFGTSGVGKTTYLQHLILTLIAQGHRIFIIDPENEYSEVVEYFGGTVIHLSSTSKTCINPLEIFSDALTDDEMIKNKQENNVENLIKQKCQRLKGLFKVIKSNMTQVETSIVEGLVMSLYDKLRLVKDIYKMKHEDYPIFEDLYKACGKLQQANIAKFSKIEDFYFILESYVYGSNSLFNGYTNIDLTNDIVSFDLKSLQTEIDVQGACYLNTFSFLWDEITKEKQDDSKYSYMFIDEFHFLTKNKESRDFFFQAYKRFRKYKAGAIATTQQIEDILKADSELGVAVIENSLTKVFFGMDNSGVENVIKKLKINFSKPEISLLRAKRQGEALIIYGTQRVFMKVDLTEEELRLCNKKRYSEKYGCNPDEQPDYSGRLYISALEMEEINAYE